MGGFAVRKSVEIVDGRTGRSPVICFSLVALCVYLYIKIESGQRKRGESAAILYRQSVVLL